MDGVLVNLMKGIQSVYGEIKEEIRWDVWAHYKMSPEAFWEPLGVRQFWESLEPYKYYKELYSLCSAYGDVYILTSPINTGGCYVGKINWLKKHLPETKKIFTRYKYLLANDNSILIDDFNKNLGEFKVAGGRTFKWEQTWNTGAPRDHRELMDELSEVLAWKR